MKIMEIQNQGTIVRVLVDETPFVINMDHRMFQHMYEDEDGNLIGRDIKVHDDDCGQRIEFEEKLEA